MSDHTSAKHFKCSVCDSVFEDVSNLRLHLSVHTEEHSSKCSVCGKALKNRFNFWEHMHAHADEKTFKCNVCYTGFKDMCILTEHMLVHTEDKFFKCCVCHKTFKKKHSVYSHMRVHMNGKPCKGSGGHIDFKEKEVRQSRVVNADDDFFICSICHKAFKQRRNLREHIRIHTNEKPFKCSVCDEAFRNPTSLWQHMHIHSEEVYYRCKVCLEAFRDKNTRESHMAIHKCKCPECGKELMKTDLRAHTKLCLSNNLYKCSECHESFSNNETLKKHMVKHSNKSHKKIISEMHSDIDNVIASSSKRNLTEIMNSTETLKCGVYQNVFKDKRSLWQHIHDHADETPYSCRMCLEVFKEKSSWENHIIQKCRCTLCGKLSSNMEANVHLKICPINNPYKCKICCKRFSGNDIFKEHMVEHSMEESCKCKVCGEFILSKYDAQKHKELHSDAVKVCKCKVCGELIVSKYDAQKHKELHADAVNSVDPLQSDITNPFYINASSSSTVCDDSLLHLKQDLCFVKVEPNESEGIVNIKEEKDNVSNDFSNTVKEEKVFVLEDNNFFDKEFQNASNSCGSAKDINLNNFIMMADAQVDHCFDNSIVDPLS